MGHIPIFDFLMNITDVPIPRLAFDQKEFKTNFLSKNEPVILTGLLDNWKSTKEWSLEYLLDNYPSESFLAAQEQADDGEDKEAQLTPYGLSYSFKKLEDCIVLSKKDSSTILSPDFVVLTQPITDESVLADGIGRLDHVMGKKVFVRNFFIWKNEHYSHFHFDPAENLMTQLRGSKKIILASPDNWRKFYLQSLATGDPQFSSIDFRQQDLTAFPKVKDIQFRECTIHGGEVLYIPQGWFHQVTSLSDDTFSIPHFFLPSVVKIFRFNLLPLILRSVMFRIKLLLKGDHFVTKLKKINEES